MTNNKINEFIKKLNSNGVLGPFCKTLDAAFIEVIGYSGFDFCILDMEHGAVGTENLTNLIRSCKVANIISVVRVPEISEQAVGKPLDLGADAIQIPQVCTAEDAKKAISLAKFYPKGERGVCRFVRAANYSEMDKKEYFKKANECLVIIQLEGQEAIDNLDEILEVEGIDIIFIGPYDLSQSLGIPGDTTNPIVIKEMQKILEKSEEKGIKVGTFTDSIETMEMWKKAGVQYISYSVDVGIFYESCRKLVNTYQNI